MGTRNLTAVFFNGEYRVAQYGQWDGYPSGQGLTILNLLSDKSKLEKLKENLLKVRFVDDEKDKGFLDEYNNNAPEWSSESDNRTYEQKRWFSSYASRDLGGKILPSIALSDDDEILLFDKISFAGDSLFCEFAYVVDLDKNTFEVYEGFNKEELDLSERFASTECDHDEYKQVKFKHSFDISSLPSEKEFLLILQPDEED